MLLENKINPFPPVPSTLCDQILPNGKVEVKGTSNNLTKDEYFQRQFNNEDDSYINKK